MLARLQREARLRRLQGRRCNRFRPAASLSWNAAVRSAASRVQQQRLLSFRKHFVRQKTIEEEAAQIQKARITLADISALEDELRLALSQMGAAHQSALTFNAQITEEMLRQNESFKAHVTMSNVRFEAAIELIRAFRHEQRVLKSAPLEQRAISFQRAKELLKKIASINERTKRRYATMVPCHPYDSIHELTSADNVDFRVTRIHADIGAPDAISLARLEDERHQERIQQTDMMRQKQAQIAERRAEAAMGAVQSRRTATEVRALLQEAVVHDRKRKLQAARQRSALPRKPKQSKIKRAFESALPELRTVQRQQDVRQAQRRLSQNVPVRDSPRSDVHSESADDLLERFASFEDTAVVPNDILRNIVNIIDDGDERKEEDSIAATADVFNSQDAALNDCTDRQTTTSKDLANNEREVSTLSPPFNPVVNDPPHADAGSATVTEERRAVSFNVTFDDDPRRSRPKRRLPSSRTTSPDLELRSRSPEAQPVTDNDLLEANIQSKSTVNSDASAPPQSQVSTDDHFEQQHIDLASELKLQSEQIFDPQPEDHSLEEHRPSLQSFTHADVVSESVSEQSCARAPVMSEMVSEPDIVANAVNEGSEHVNGPIASESVVPTRETEAQTDSVVDLTEQKSTVDPASLPDLFEITSQSGVDISMLPSVDLSLEDLDELDRRAEELLRSHIPTTPQLLALPRESSQNLIDFKLDDDGDDYAIRMLGVDSEELAASFAQTLDETLAFLRQSRVEIDNLRSEVTVDHRDSRQENGEYSRDLDPAEQQPRRIITILEDDTASDSQVRSVRNQGDNDDLDALTEQESKADESIADHVDSFPQEDLNTSAISSEKTTDDDRSSSLQEQFRANVALIERIEQRRTEVRRRRQSN